MSYWKKGEFHVTEGYAPEDPVIKVIDEGSHEARDHQEDFAKHLFTGGTMWTHHSNPRNHACDREHEFWVVHSDQLLEGDKSAPGYDADLIRAAKASLRALMRYLPDGSEFPQTVAVLIHKEKVLPRERVSVSTKEILKARKREDTLPARDAARRARNLERLGSEEPNWPQVGQHWRRVSDDEVVQVTGLDGWGASKIIYWSTATHYGNTKQGAFIGDYRLIE